MFPILSFVSLMLQNPFLFLMIPNLVSALLWSLCALGRWRRSRQAGRRSEQQFRRPPVAT